LIACLILTNHKLVLNYYVIITAYKVKIDTASTVIFKITISSRSQWQTESVFWQRNFFLDLYKKKPDDGSTEFSTFPERITILTDVSIESYRKFREEERKLNLFIRLFNGKVIAYETSNIHSSVQSIMNILVGTWHHQLIPHTRTWSYYWRSWQLCRYRNYTSWEKKPTMIVGIGVADSKKFTRSCRKVLFWADKYTSLFGNKLWLLRQDGTTVIPHFCIYVTIGFE
jgi:hypothetical protein